MARTFSITYQTLDKSLHIKEDLEFAATRAAEYTQIRPIKSYKGQKHMPGFYYMQEPRELVAYESRLEQTILLQLDYNPSVIKIISQPFILHVEGKNSFNHIPDYLTIKCDGNVEVIDVKPKQYVPEFTTEFSATKAACHSVGWSYSVRSEPQRLFLENLRWLAGFRAYFPTVDLFAEPLIKSCTTQPITIDDLVGEVGPPVLVRPVLFHLLWHRALAIDIYAQFRNDSVIDLPREAFRHGI